MGLLPLPYKHVVNITGCSIIGWSLNAQVPGSAESACVSLVYTVLGPTAFSKLSTFLSSQHLPLGFFT